jgi:hypothetical protein
MSSSSNIQRSDVGNWDAAYKGIIEDYDKAVTFWKKSELRQETTKFFKETILPLQNLEIDQVIVIGGGTLHSHHDFGAQISFGYHPDQHKAPMYQFVEFEYWVSLLKTKFDLSGKIYLQDPWYNYIDKAFIESKGFKVIPAPNSFESSTAHRMMTSKTFLFIPVGGFTQLIKRAIEVAHPALMIGQRIEQPSHSAWNERKKMMVSCGRLVNYDRLDFKGEHMMAGEIARRKLFWPYYSSHLAKPMWTFTNHLDEHTYVKNLAYIRTSDLGAPPDDMIWVRGMWVFWKPDDESRLKVLKIEEDLDCQCFGCQAELPFVPPSMRIDRPPSMVSQAED